MSNTTTAVTRPQASPEAQLLSTVQAAGIRELARSTTPAIREMMADMSLGLTREVAVSAPKIFQLKRAVGERDVVKLLVAVLRAFVDSVRAQTKPDAADLMEAAEYFAQTYTHDSIKDIMLALKEARTGGTLKTYYSTLDVAAIYEIISTYFDKKALYLESAHHDRKAQGAGTEYEQVKLLGSAAPKMLDNVAQQIPQGHPNASSIRQKLSLIKARLKRGLLDPEQAEQQRTDARNATHRKPRPDWQPNPEAQKEIDKRHRAEDRRLAEKYRTRSL
ncbi:hypothetical protein [Hymenobacter rubripertinctus]|nr:hypothetical protein [Hymenobacter rubripertinctus]